MSRRAGFAKLRVLLTTALPGCALLACATPPPLVELSEGRVAMGTVLDVQLVVSDAALGRSVLERVFEQIAELDGLLSHYHPGSQVSRLSTTAGEGPQRVDRAVAELCRLALRYGALTGGAFDVTLGPLTQLWGYSSREDVTYEEVARVREMTGLAHLIVHDDEHVELARRGMALDFGGIAKGYALDRVRPLLEGAGVDAALASFGQSSIWAFGAPPEREGWELGLRSPAGGFAGSVTLSDQALSVSSSFGAPGDAAASVHVVDPHTGWPLPNPSFVAVVSNDATLAEALSTALLLLHHEEGIALVESQRDTEALIVDDQGRIAHSSGWLEASRFREQGAGFRGLDPNAR